MLLQMVGSPSPLLLSDVPLDVQHSCFVQSSVDGHLGCLTVLAVVNE